MLVDSLGEWRNQNLQPSTFSSTVWALVQATAASALCVLSAEHRSPLQRASSAFWSESPFHPKR